MNIKKFTTTDGRTVWLNPDRIDHAELLSDGTVCVETPDYRAIITEEDFTKTISENNNSDSHKDIIQIGRRLIEALDRLSMRIPSSIRMHL